MKKEKLQWTAQKYKGSYETTISSYVPIKWTTYIFSLVANSETILNLPHKSRVVQQKNRDLTELKSSTYWSQATWEQKRDQKQDAFTISQKSQGFFDITSLFHCFSTLLYIHVPSFSQLTYLSFSSVWLPQLHLYDPSSQVPVTN